MDASFAAIVGALLAVALVAVGVMDWRDRRSGHRSRRRPTMSDESIESRRDLRHGRYNLVKGSTEWVTQRRRLRSREGPPNP